MANGLVMQLGMAALLGAALVGGVQQAAQPTTGFGSMVAASGLNPDCRVKGNVSINSGARIYHVPGQEFYAATRISPERGERWFCSEADARKAGWRRARS